MKPLIELTDYTLAPRGTGTGLFDFNFSLCEGDVYSIETESADDASLFLKALATLVNPTKGIYRFNGERIDLSDYRKALPCKKRIGYLTLNNAMISNRTIRENLLFMRYFDENSLFISLDDHTAELCRRFDMIKKLDMKPGELHSQDILNAITIRELCKPPDVLLLERPEDVMDHTKFDFFIKRLKNMLLSGMPVVFFSFDADFVATFSNKKILISEGRLATIS